MKMNKIALSVAVAAGLVSTAGISIAATTSSNLNVTATVAAVCLIDSTADVAFGNIVTNSATNYDAAGSVDWRCTVGTSPSVSIDGGSAGSVSGRAMTGALNSDSLDYQLYTSAARTIVFGDGSTGSTVTGTGAGMSNAVTTDIYGRILDTDVASVSADNYSDVVSVTLTF